MVKTSLRALEPPFLGMLRVWLLCVHLICMTMATGPASSPCSCAQGRDWSALFPSFLGSVVPLGSSFSLHTEGFFWGGGAGLPLATLTGFRFSFRRIAFAWENIRGHSEYYSQVFEAFPPSPLLSNHSRMLPIKKQAGQISGNRGH